MKKILVFCCVLSIALIYGVGFCTYMEESPEKESSTSGDSLFTKYEDDALSVDIKDVPLGEVLQKLSEETGVVFSFSPAIGEERVMVRFSNFKIADAINKILSSHDRIFIYEETQPDSDPSLPSRLKEVRIFTPPPRGTTKGGTAAPPTLTKRGTATSPTITSDNNSRPSQPATQRKTAKRSSARTSGSQTVASLGNDLKNSDYRVRLDSVRNLRSIGNADAIGHLTSALEDKNPDVSNAAKIALGELQDDPGSEEIDKGTDAGDNREPVEGSPVFAMEVVSQDAGSVALDFNLYEVPESLITAAMMIEFNPEALKIVDAKFQDGWDPGMSNTVKEPIGPGSYMFTAGNLSNVNPDDSSTIGLANIQFECLTGNCSGEVIQTRTVPKFDSVVGKSAKIHDSDMPQQTFTIP